MEELKILHPEAQVVDFNLVDSRDIKPPAYTVSITDWVPPSEKAVNISYVADEPNDDENLKTVKHHFEKDKRVNFRKRFGLKFRAGTILSDTVRPIYIFPLIAVDIPSGFEADSEPKRVVLRDKQKFKSDKPEGIYLKGKRLVSSVDELYIKLKEQLPDQWALGQKPIDALNDSTSIRLVCRYCGSELRQSGRRLLIHGFDGLRCESPGCHDRHGQNYGIFMGQAWPSENVLKAHLDELLAPFPDLRLGVIRHLPLTTELSVTVVFSECDHEQMLERLVDNGVIVPTPTCSTCRHDQSVKDETEALQALSHDELADALQIDGFEFVRFEDRERSRADEARFRAMRRRGEIDIDLGGYVVVACQTCGTEKNEYVRTVYSRNQEYLKTGKLRKSPVDKCSQCSVIVGTYATFTDQILKIFPGYEVLAWKDRRGYTVDNLKERAWSDEVVVMRCDQGHEFQRDAYGLLVKELGCPACIGPHFHLTTLLRRAEDEPEVLGLKRWLYWIKMHHASSNTIFYKIGLANSQTLKARYPDSALKADGLRILEQQVLQCANIEAVLTERHVLMKYHDQLLNTQKWMRAVSGGTECFRANVLGGQSLKSVLHEALDQEHRIGHKALVINWARDHTSPPFILTKESNE